uniref:Uncharacterized protein n=1 Tax=Anguilla anguilla TaxID=7936 RepID=A0A0E9XER9_ANGAN
MSLEYIPSHSTDPISADIAMLRTLRIEDYYACRLSMVSSIELLCKCVP